MVKQLRALLILLLATSMLVVGCTPKPTDIKESNTYSNLYYALEYPDSWSEPTIYAHKVIFENPDSTTYFDIQALYFDGSLDALLPKEGLEACNLGDAQGYKITMEQESEIRTFYLAHKDNTLFQLTFAFSPDDQEAGNAIMEQITQSFAFNDFKAKSLASWNTYNAENITIYYPNDSVIADGLEPWAQKRIDAFDAITKYLDVDWTYEPIKMFVFNSQEQGARYGMQLGVAIGEFNQVYTLYNQTIGHELAHVISDRITGVKTDSALLNEGIATHLNMTGIDYDKASIKILKEKNYQVDLLGDSFRKLGSEVGYPLAASFVKYLIDTYGLDTFKACFAQNKYSEAESFVKFYQKEGSVLIAEWMEYLKAN